MKINLVSKYLHSSADRVNQARPFLLYIVNFIFILLSSLLLDTRRRELKVNDLSACASGDTEEDMCSKRQKRHENLNKINNGSKMRLSKSHLFW